MIDLSFFRGKKVFLTGHTGFKGSWMSRILLRAGAELTGYSLAVAATPNLFSLADVERHMHSICGDICDFDALKAAFSAAKPEIVIHMAAQPIVLEGYRVPRYTYETNVMGTVNLLECVRTSSSVASFINVTTDKVYENREWCWGYRENEKLNGFDPYSNSKSCSELVTNCYKNSFLEKQAIPVSTARAGNVIGGGDFAEDRIIPDCVRAQLNGAEIVLRNPHSTRPYQHVLEPVMAYLMIAEKQHNHPELADTYNVGPDDCDCVTTGQLADLFCAEWGEGARWTSHGKTDMPHEARFLKLDCTKLKTAFGWKPRWHIDQAIRMTCAWTKVWRAKDSVPDEMDRQIKTYELRALE